MRPDGGLAALAERYWQWTCREFPLTAFMAGTPNDDPVMFRESSADIDRRAREAAALRTELAAVPNASLDAADRATHRLLARELDDLCTGQALGAHQRPWLLPVGPEFNTVFFANMSSVVDGASAQRYVDRIATLPAFIGDVMGNLREGRTRGFRYPRVVVSRAESNVRASIDAAVDALPWFGPFRRSVAMASPEVQAHAERAKVVIEKQLVPSLAALADLMRDELAPHARDSIACTDEPLGRESYEHWVRHFTTTELSPDDIHALGVSEALRIEAEIAEVAAEAGSADDVAAYRRFIAEDPQFVAASAEALRERVEVIAKRIDRQIPAFFGRVPRITYGVESIPAALAARMPPAYAQPNPGDGSTSGILWVSGIPSMCPLYLAPSLALHEGWPGHLMHIALMQEADALPAFRRFNAVKYTACLEGWALYCEGLGEEMKLYETPHQRFGRLDMELWRALRLVVDTGIHWKGWGRERAIHEMCTRLSLSRETIEGEVDRYIALPAQALAYQIGNLKFRELRARAESALGERFRLRDYHDMLMAAGPVTLPVLDDTVQAWIAA
jgi:uncharacterized protein (DUF885 family)